MSFNISKMRATTYALVAVISCASVSLAGCVPSYTAPRAILHIDLAATEKSAITVGIARGVVEDLGFEWVQEQDRSNQPSYTDISQCRWLGNTCLYSFDEPKMSLSIVDHSDVDAFRNQVDYAPTDTGVIEINVYRYRAAGFDDDALQIYASLKNSLNRALVGRIREIRPPPPDEGFFSAHLIRSCAFALTVLLLFGLATAAASWGLYLLLSRTGLPVAWQKVTIVAIITSLLAPMPVPMTVFAMVMPNAIVLLSANAEYYSRIWRFALPSVAITGVVSALVVWGLFRQAGTNTTNARIP